MKPATQHPLLTLSEDEVKAAYDAQCSKGAWTFSDERQFAENLFCQRFNFLLVVYSLIIAGAASTSSALLFKIILSVGLVVTVLTSCTVWRSYAKVIVTLQILYRIAEHPISVVHRENQARHVLQRSFAVNLVLGVLIPLFCSASLLLGVILAVTNVIGPTK